MAGFNFERNLEHQTQAVNAVLAAYENMSPSVVQNSERQYVNPFFDLSAFDWQYRKNLVNVQNIFGINIPIKGGNILDAMMETGTGKTYTYTKTIFELNKRFGIFKFVIIVPTLPIKAGTIDFLRSENCRQHFKEQYGKSLKLHVVESKKSNKPKKSYFPPAVSSFVDASSFDKDSIHVLIINAGMINSNTMQKKYDRSFIDKYSVPFEAISAVKPIAIIDEPHKFSQSNESWHNIQKINPQIILRYGATFENYENLVYELTAVKSFNLNLVKGVSGHIESFEGTTNVIVKFVNSDGTEASFELQEGNSNTKKIKLVKKESLEKVHPAMQSLYIENLNKTEVILSNGLSLKKGDKINPYIYAEKLQEKMIQRAVREHFILEKQLLTRETRIKPLTLFFIDNIEEYRSKEGYLRKSVEEAVKNEVTALLKTEKHENYKRYLEETLKNLATTHAGYFAQDNAESDEVIEKEINEILHDKQAILDLKNVRRFVFSEWTLREGWDNPNVFQICKLRSSGSEISKLQEVGRGLRLPVNEYGNRVKDEQFYLNYFVDFTEQDFIEKLRNEINSKSHTISSDAEPDKLTNEIINRICEDYSLDESELLEELDSNNVITRTNEFKPKGFEFVKNNYPLIFNGISQNKIRTATDAKKKVTIRTEKYNELKELWEKLNEKVVLEYKIKSEKEFRTLLNSFFSMGRGLFENEKFVETKSTIVIENNIAVLKDSTNTATYQSVKLSSLNYSEFLTQLSVALSVNLKTLDSCMQQIGFDINDSFTQSTIRKIKQNFEDYILRNALTKFEIAYHRVSNQIHPTKLTDKQGSILDAIDAYEVGTNYSTDLVSEKYLFNELFFDSDLECENIKANLDQVVVFTKIPKNSIRIPVSGGRSYSPDFAYVLKFTDGYQKLFFVVETKDTELNSLREEEIQKIKHAEALFKGAVSIKFNTQFSTQKIVSLVNEVYNQEKRVEERI